MAFDARITALAQAIGADIKSLTSGKVDKVPGKGLSSADFLPSEKNKLASLGNYPVADGLTNVLTKGVFGLHTTQIAPAGGITYMAVMEIEADALAFSMIMPNLSSQPVVGVKVAMCVGTGFYADDQHWYTPPSLPGNTGWLTLRKDGQESVTLAPSTLNNVVAWTQFDLAGMRTQPRTGGGRPVIAVRMQFPAGAVITLPANGVYGWRVADGRHRTLRVTKQNVMGIDDFNAYTAQDTQDDGVVVPVVQYVTVHRGSQILICGDSIPEGIGSNTRCYGAAQRAANDLSTLLKPVEYVNAGLYAQGPPVYSKAVGYFAPLIQPSAVFYSVYSINNTPDGGMPQYAIDEDYFGLTTVLSQLRLLPRPPKLVLLEGLPTNPNFRDLGAGDQARRDMNTYLPSVGGADVAGGYAATVTGTRLATGQDQFKDDYTDDGAHPNDTGYDALSEVLRPFIATLGTQAGTPGTPLTAADIRDLYEANADRNAFTNLLKARLLGIAEGAQVNTVNSVAGKTGVVTLAKADVGLGNVDNTADTTKPVSTAQQAALNAKEPTVAAGTAAQYWNGLKVFADFATSVRASVLTGLALTVSTAVVATDTVLAGMGKLQKQITDLGTTLAGKASKAGDTFTGKILGTLLSMAGYMDKVTVSTTATGTVTLDLSTASVFDLTLTGNTTLAFANLPVLSGELFTVVVIVRQGTTAFTLAQPSGVTPITTGGAAVATPGASKQGDFIYSTKNGTAFELRAGAAT